SPASGRPAASACPCRRRTSLLAFPLARIECLLKLRDELLFACGLVLGGLVLARLAELEDELEPAAGDGVPGGGGPARRLRVAGEVEVELGARRELERERVAAQPGRMRLAQQRRRRDAAAFLDGRKHLVRPGLLQLGELELGAAPDRDGNRRGLWLGCRCG